MISWQMALAWVLSTVGALFVGGYLASYMKRKGENYATKEDAADILTQVKATTQATKEIESKISGELWNKQKQWEVKKEAIFNCVKRISQVEETLLGLHGLRQIEQKPGDINFETAQHEKAMAFRDASAAFDEAKLMIAITCGTETAEAVYALGAAALAIAQPLASGSDRDAYKTGGLGFVKKLTAAKMAIRKELSVEERTFEQFNISKGLGH
jgi:hypothetical protein